MFAIEPALLAKIAKPQFPDYAISVVKSLRKERDASLAASEVRHNQRNAMIERKDGLYRRYALFVRDKRDEPGWNSEAEAMLQEARQEYDEAVAELNEFDAASVKSVAANARPVISAPHIIPFTPNPEEWVRARRLGERYRHVDTPLPTLRKGEELADVLDRLIGDAERIMQKLSETENAPLPVEDALAKWRRDVDRRASEGELGFGTLFRAKPSAASGHFSQGSVRWPKHAIATQYEADVTVENGTALLATVFHDQLMEYGERLIRERAKQFKLAPIPLAERPKRIAALQAELLGVHRQIERIESELRKQKIEFDPCPYPVHILAILRCEFDKVVQPKREKPMGNLVEENQIDKPPTIGVPQKIARSGLPSTAPIPAVSSVTVTGKK